MFWTVTTNTIWTALLIHNWTGQVESTESIAIVVGVPRAAGSVFAGVQTVIAENKMI